MFFWVKTKERDQAQQWQEPEGLQAAPEGPLWKEKGSSALPTPQISFLVNQTSGGVGLPPGQVIDNRDSQINSQK